MSQYTSREQFKEDYETLHATFKTGRTRDLRWRKWQLKQLWWLLTDNEDAIVHALKSDLNRNTFESLIADVLAVKNEVLLHIDNLEKWAYGEAPPGAGIVMGTLGKAWLRKEPLGVAFIIGAWNYPLYTLLMPAVGAISAGNCVMLKPSEQAQAVQDVISSLVSKYLDPSTIRSVTGGGQETSFFLEHKFNHICYTGGSKVARLIAGAAAKHLTPVVLELGGQNPTIVTKTANIDLAAKRIANVKLSNAGQICLNVNHVFADPAIHDALADRIKHYLSQWITESAPADISCIISANHYKRISDLLHATAGTTTYTGSHDEKTRFIHPTIITEVTPTDALLSEEIFAPLIPIIKADTVTALKIMAEMPSPLALYIFSSSQSEIDHILASTASGGVTINDTMLHAVVPGAPFGGVGESGYGAYRGKVSFDTFSHTRTVVGLPDWFDTLMASRYYPWKAENRKTFEQFPKVKFYKGETLEDQSVGKNGGWFSWLW